MKPLEILDKIKDMVGVELSEEKIEFAEIKLENGTVLVAESFESGKSVFVKTEDEEIALPVGRYELEDGRILVVTEEGLIDSIKEAVEEETAEELTEETQETELEEEEEKEEMKYVTREEFGKAIDEIKAMIQKMGEGKEEKEEMKSELNENQTDLIEAIEKEELSAEENSPIKHNPESSSNNFKITISGSRLKTTKDRVYNAIFNN